MKLTSTFLALFALLSLSTVVMGSGQCFKDTDCNKGGQSGLCCALVTIAAIPYYNYTECIPTSANGTTEAFQNNTYSFSCLEGHTSCLDNTDCGTQCCGIL